MRRCRRTWMSLCYVSNARIHWANHGRLFSLTLQHSNTIYSYVMERQACTKFEATNQENIRALGLLSIQEYAILLLLCAGNFSRSLRQRHWCRCLPITKRPISYLALSMRYIAIDMSLNKIASICYLFCLLPKYRCDDIIWFSKLRINLYYRLSDGQYRTLIEAQSIGQADNLANWKLYYNYNGEYTKTMIGEYQGRATTTQDSDFD